MRLRAGRLAAAAALAALVLPGAAEGKEIDCAALLVHVRTLTALLERAELLETAAGKCPRDGGIAYERAYALERLRRYPEALAGYRAATELDPSNAKAHFGHGEMLARHGDPVGAVAALERGLALDPSNKRVLKPLELARIGARAQVGEEVTAAELVRALTESDLRAGAADGTDGPVIRLPIPFRAGSSKVDAAAAKRLEALGEALRAAPLAGARVEISGHVDDDGKKPDASVALSTARAGAVRDHLVARFKLAPERFTVKGYGSTRPIVSDATPEARSQNRRIEFRLIK